MDTDAAVMQGEVDYMDRADRVGVIYPVKNSPGMRTAEKQSLAPVV